MDQDSFLEGHAYHTGADRHRLSRLDLSHHEWYLLKIFKSDIIVWEK